MQIIQPAVPLIPEVIGRQKPQKGKYRLLKYTVQHPVEEGMLLYNVATRGMVLLSPEEHQNLLKNEQLIQEWFLVPEDFDDKKFWLQIKNTAKLLQKKRRGINGYTIFTTTDCNARCFYCFEKGQKKVHMSQETAQKVAQFIMDNMGDFNDVRLSWFGGEPLYNQAPINTICKILLENNIPFTSGMTTNGYLFDTGLVKKAAREWNLKTVQITMDGSEKIYNKTKAYIYKDCDSPYQRVLENIRLLLEGGIQVSIRLNVSQFNYQDMYILADELLAQFSSYKNLTIYTARVFGEFVKKRAPEEEKQVRKCSNDITKKMMINGLQKKIPARKTIRLNCCKADSDNAVTVLPSGHLGKCEHYGDDHFVGHIDSGIDQKKADIQKETIPEGPMCADCPAYPDEIPLKICNPMAGECLPAKRQDAMNRYYLRMQITYDIFKKKQQTE